MLPQYMHKYSYATNNILIGSAELHAVEVRGVSGWATLGGGFISDKPTAVRYAQQLDELIQRNAARTNNHRYLRTSNLV